MNTASGGVRVQPGSPIKKFDASWKAAVARAKCPNLLFHDLPRSATRNMRKAGIELTCLEFIVSVS